MDCLKRQIVVNQLVSIIERYLTPDSSSFKVDALNLNLPKSFKMMKLLNHHHGWGMRSIAAASAYVLAMVTTRQHRLAKALSRCFWLTNDFKAGARLGAWYARRSWLQLDVSKDDFFDPTDKMIDLELDALAYFIETRKASLDPIDYMSDIAFIAARRLDNHANPKQLTNNIHALKVACDALLVCDVPASQQASQPTKNRTGDFPIDDAKQALSDFITLFPLTDLKWFFVSGTFLGLIRDQGFLPHDYDIDLGVFESDIDIEATCEALHASKQFVLKKYDHHRSQLFTPDTVSTNPDIPYILKIIHASGVHIDLFIHYKDQRTTPATYWHGSSLHRWENSAFELVSYPFYTYNVFGPADADTYLTENYGDWRTPVTEFNCTTDTPNLALVPHPIAVVIFIKRYVYAKADNAQAAAHLQEELIANKFLVLDAAKLSFSGDLFAK